jgi:Domain of unknown function (DUF5615)
MRFMLDENMPVTAAEKLIALGHEAEFVRDYVPAGSPDPLVAAVSQELDAILLSFDGDFEKIAPRVPAGERARFRRLSRIWMPCREGRSAARLENAIDLIEREYEIARDKPRKMRFCIGDSFLRTDR